MDRLSPGASGLRHLRWGREIVATLEAYASEARLLTPEERATLGEEASRMREAVQRLSGAVKPYRDFLERTRVAFRGRQRAGSFACEEARRRAEEILRLSGSDGPNDFHGEEKSTSLEEHRKDANHCREAAARLRSLADAPASALGIAIACEEAAALLEAHNEAYVRMEDEQRRPLQAAVRVAAAELHADLERMNARLEERFPQRLIESLYPTLTREGIAVADEEDEDDDASAPAHPPAPASSPLPTAR